MSDEIEFAPELPKIRPLAELLDDVRVFVRRFVVISDEQSVAITLWAAHTHVFDAFSCTPYLAISSPLKRSGKTRLMEVLDLLACRTLPTANISDAALFRVISERHPTLLVDEVDAIFGKKSPRDELRGILNAGYRHGAQTHRMGGSNMTTLQTFDVFCPKAFAGIGDALPDTITDRSIPIRMGRRDASVERFRQRDVTAEGHVLRDGLAVALAPRFDDLAAARPALPDELDDRAQDVWEPLLAIADDASSEWGALARAAAIALSTGEERDDDSTAALLIRDVAAIFDASEHSRISTADLLAALHEIDESPWGDWYGKPLTSHALSKLLRPYRVKTMPVYVEGETVRGYKVEQFRDAFAQLRVRSVSSVRSEASADPASNASNASNAWASDERSSNGSGPLLGSDEFEAWNFARFEHGEIDEDEWKLMQQAHRDALALTEGT